MATDKWLDTYPITWEQDGYVEQCYVTRIDPRFQPMDGSYHLVWRGEELLPEDLGMANLSTSSQDGHTAVHGLGFWDIRLVEANALPLVYRARTGRPPLRAGERRESRSVSMSDHSWDQLMAVCRARRTPPGRVMEILIETYLAGLVIA